MPLENIQKHEIEVNGNKTFFTTSGFGDPLLFLPGWGGAKPNFPAHFHELSKHYQLITFNPPEYSEVRPFKKGYTIEKFVSSVDEFLKFVGNPNLPIIGFSFGGLVALKYASQSSNVKRIVTIGTPTYFSLKAKFAPLVDYLDRMSTFIEKKGLNEPIVQKIQSWIAPNSKCELEDDNILANLSLGGWVDVLRLVLSLDIKQVCKKIRVPVLIVQGEHDMISPLYEAKRFAKIIPRSDLYVLPKTNHCNYFCCNPSIRELEDVVLKFLQSGS